MSQIWAGHKETYRQDNVNPGKFHRKVKQSKLSTVAEALGIVAGGDEEVCEDGQLVLGERLLVLCPVVLVGSLEVLQKKLVKLTLFQEDISPGRLF